MSTYTIGEVAERTGFTASALRYYGRRGLLEPSTRTDAGYRLYNEEALARLAFIARAKQLGCSLDEISDLVALWDGERCGPVQRRFHDLVTAKIDAAQQQIAELTALAGQLQHAAAQLAGPATDGPCGEGCACVSSTAVSLVARADDRPLACTLPADGMPQRLASWQVLLACVESRTRTDSGALRLSFSSALDVTQLASLVAAEHECCSFFSFVITVDDNGIALEVTAPDESEGVVESLFGAAA